VKTIDQEQKEFGHVVLFQLGKLIVLLLLCNYLYAMYKSCGANCAILAEHEVSQKVPFMKQNGIIIFL
jgi:hypothetical protein